MAKKPRRSKESPQEKKPNPRLLLVYKEPTVLSDKKVGCIFLPLTAEEFEAKRLPDELPRERLYGGTVPKGIGRPGSIYEFEYPEGEEGTIYPTTRRWLGFLSNDPRVVEWQAKHDAFHIDQERQREEKKGKTTNLIQRQLAPLKLAYAGMVGHRRAAFLAEIIGYVTGRVTTEDTKLAKGEDDE